VRLHQLNGSKNRRRWRRLCWGVYLTFIEGFDTVDLLEAKALLAELG